MRSRILLVSHAADLTGAPRIALEIVASLGADLERIVVLRRRGEREPAYRASADRVSVEPLHRLSRFLRHFDRLRRLEALLARAIAGLELWRFRPELVYLNTSEAGGYVGPALRRGIPVILHLHEPREAIEQILGPHRVDRALPSVTLVVASEPARQELAELTGLPAADIRVLPSTIDAESVTARARSAPVDQLTIGTLGSPTVQKGVDLWPELVEAVAHRVPGARFVWVGGMPPGRVAARVDALGLGDRVAFWPATTDPIGALHEFSILAILSRAETSGMVVQEGMAVGLPIVAFRLPTTAAHLGDTGLLVARGDVGAMADAIVALARDPDRRRRLGEAARRRALEQFSMTGLRRGARELVDEMLGTTRPG